MIRVDVGVSPWSGNIKVTNYYYEQLSKLAKMLITWIGYLGSL